MNDPEQRPFELDPATGLPIGPPVDPTPARAPEAVVLEGRYARLEPIGPQHLPGLLEASTGPGTLERFLYLADEPPRDLADMERWLAGADHGGQRLGFAVIDTSTGRVGGRLFLLGIVPAHRKIEVGNILFGHGLSRTRVSTDAIHVIMRHCFEQLGYSRFEWKCNRLNAPSRRAAERFGFVFEGIFRADMIIRGRLRDTAWYSITADEWPRVREGFERWLDPENFDEDGQQRISLSQHRENVAGESKKDDEIEGLAGLR
jgi:RimJ/RimL family protein N-acetyltransferase